MRELQEHSPQFMFRLELLISDEWIEQIETDLTEELILLIRPFGKHFPEEWRSIDN